MRLLLVVGLLLGGFTVMAFEDTGTEAEESLIRVHSVRSCNFWTNITGANGRWGYACASSPSFRDFADGHDTQRVIRSLEARIRKLEQQLAAQ